MSNKRNYAIDSLKFFCIIGVICLHAVPFNEIQAGNVGNRYLGFIVDTVARVCVPLFFMITGYFFYGRSNKSYAVKHTANSVKKLVVWSIIYVVFDIFIHNIQESRPVFNGAAAYVESFRLPQLYYATGIVHYHLWYITAMIVVFPLMYFIISKNIIDKALIVSLILNLIGIFMPVFIKGDLWIKVRDGIFLGLFYSLLGVFIKKNEDKLSNMMRKTDCFKYILSIIILFGISIAERYIYLKKFKGAGNYFLSTIPLAILIFTLCLRQTDIFKNNIISRMGQHTLGVYLIHPMIISFINLVISMFDVNWLRNTTVWQICCVPIVYILSYLLYSIFLRCRHN